ncbi:hypothetical protein ACFPRL_11045 [Pseudoclavibacter helvolus]
MQSCGTAATCATGTRGCARLRGRSATCTARGCHRYRRRRAEKKRWTRAGSVRSRQENAVVFPAR